MFTGARVGEVIGADAADLGTDRRHRLLWVTRNQERHGLPLPPAAAARLDAYLASRKARRTGPLFATSTGGRLFPADVWRVVRRLAARAGLPADLAGHLGPHAMRRSFATLYLDAGGSLRDLQNALGHADPRATGRYDRRPALNDGALNDGALGDGALGDGALGDGAPGDRAPGDRAPGDRAPGDLVAAYLADPASGRGATLGG